MERGCWPPQDDGWDEVWDAYEARCATRPVAPPAAVPGVVTVVKRPALLRRGVALALFALGFAAGASWPFFSLYAHVMRQDSMALLRTLDAAPAREELRQDLRAHAGLPAGPVAGGADRMLAAMADAMAEDLTAPGALRRMVAVRGRPVDARTGGVRDAAAASLPRLRPGLAGGVALSLASAQGEEALVLRLRYAPGGWQAQGVAWREPGVAPGAVVLAGAGAAPRG